jgi:hypothetical protein
MMLLSAPFDPFAAGRVDSLWRSGFQAGTAALALIAGGLAIERLGGALSGVGQGVASGAVHGGLLAAGWIIAVRRPIWRRPVIHWAGALLLASVMSRFIALGSLLYLLPPVLVLREGVRDSALRGLGVDATVGLRHAALGLAAGIFLGAHLLLSASLTLGYAVRVASMSQYLGAVAYDVGANALTAEWLFRGALFSRWWRRWEFWPAASLSTALAVSRYLVDPALPPAVEVRAGAVFYTALVGFSACALRAASGSLVPGYMATVAFFAAYRLLVP